MLPCSHPSPRPPASLTPVPPLVTDASPVTARAAISQNAISGAGDSYGLTAIKTGRLVRLGGRRGLAGLDRGESSNVSCITASM
jgi:hypothetical protein